MKLFLSSGRVFGRGMLVALFFLICSVPSFAASTTVVISQIYTAGGNSGANYNADYVELFNLSSANVSLSGYAIQYISAAGTSGVVIALPAGVTLLPGQRYLISATPGATGAALPNTADYTASTLAAGAAAGRIYLTSSTVALSGTCPTTNVVDYVGYGTTAACYEGSKYAPAPSTTLADIRTNACVDTDNNGADFSTGAPSPRNSASTPTPCSTSTSLQVTAAVTPTTVTLGNSALFTAAVTPGSGPASTSLTVTADLSALGGSSSAAFHDDGLNGDATAGDGTYSFQLPIATGVATGSYTVTVTAADAQLRSASNMVSLTVAPAAGAVAIHTIQGAPSTYNGLSVTVSGIVTGIKSSGFFLQARDKDADSDATTSEGVYVYTGSGAVPATAIIGNELTLTGKVNVYTGSSTILPNVEIDSPTSVTVMSTANTLPTAVTLTTTLPSPSGGIYQLYQRQSMRVAVPSLITTQGTDGTFTENTETYVSNGIFWGTVAAATRPVREPGLEVLDPLTPTEPNTIPRFDDNPEVFQIDSKSMVGRVAGLDVTSGVTMTGVSGIVDFTSGVQTLLMDASNSPAMSGGTATSAAAASTAGQVTVGELNMERFYNDVADTPGAVVLTTAAYQRRLQKASMAVRNVFGMPDIMAMEEMENLTTLTALASQISKDAMAAGQTDPQYMPYLQIGNDSSAISVGFLVKPAKVNVVSVVQYGKTTTFTNSTGAQATLNDRPPLVLHAGVKRTGGTDYPLTVIVNHLRSLNGVTDATSTGATVRLKREAQAEYLANLVQGFQSSGEHVITVGDYNAFEFNDGLVDSMGVIRGTPAASNMDVLPGTSGLVSPNLVDLLPTDITSNTYTYVFAGNAQSITHFYVTPDLVSSTKVMALHLNADFPVVDRNDATTPNRTSDHDGEIGYITLPAVASSLTLSSNSLTFSSTVVGTTSASQMVTVTNSGSTTINVTGVAASANFAQTNTCMPSIAAGAKCTVTISFAPSTTGTLTGSVVLTDSDMTGTQTISLSGTGAAVTSSTALTASSNSVLAGTNVTFTATVTGNSTGTPTGMVNFLDGGMQIGSGTLSTAGVATFSTTSLAAGPHSITAVYVGASPYPTSTSTPVTVTVTGVTSTTMLAASASNVVTGASVTFTATVTGSVTGTTPTGTVNFLDGGVQIGSGTLSAAGVATFTTTTLAVGPHSITAVYVGASPYPTSTSMPVAVTVAAVTSYTSLKSSASSVVTGTSVTFTATVTGNVTAVPTGTVNFLDGTTQIGSGTLTAGVATFSTSSLGIGSHPITAAYKGDSTYPVSTSVVVPVAVTAVPVADFTLSPAALTLTVSRTSPTSVSTFALAMNNGFSSTVNFTCSGAPAYTSCSFAPASLSASGNATLTVTAFRGTGALVRPFGEGFGKTGVLVALLGLPLMLAGRKRKLLARVSGTLVAVLLLAGLGALSGCGGSTTATTTGTTPSGTSNLTVTATGGGVSHTAAVTLVVQ